MKLPNILRVHLRGFFNGTKEAQVSHAFVRFIAIANQVYQNEEANLRDAIYANAKVGVALHDAAVGAWNSKYVYNLERPETYIKRIRPKLGTKPG